MIITTMFSILYFKIHMLLCLDLMIPINYIKSGFNKITQLTIK